MEVKTEPPHELSNEAPKQTSSEKKVADQTHTSVFTCHLCKLYSKFDYYGTRPLDRLLLSKPADELTAEEKIKLANIFSKKRETVILMEKCFICDDPFSQLKAANYLILGSKCSVCSHLVCMSSECSFFYYKRRFCLKCASAFIQDTDSNEFPIELKSELIKLISNNPNLNN
jgi:hypothetical protein